VVEAIACGVPVVGSNTGGIGEILQNFAPEWAVDPNDPVAAAEAIVRLTADLSTPTTLVQGRRWVETYCSAVGYARAIARITGLVPLNASDRLRSGDDNCFLAPTSGI
jgi:glycosyltransferase involved in cell wall biosynthesis